MSHFHLTLPLALVFASSTAIAKPYDWSDATFRDATNTDLAKGVQLDWDHINQVTPTYAEQRGLAGAPTVQVRRNYVYVEDTDGSLPIPARTENDLSEWFNFAMREAYRVVPQEHVFVYVYTSFNTGVGAYFFQPQANETRGLGLPFFDNNGRSNPMEGLIFMNWWQSFEQQWGRFGAEVVEGFSRHTFNQETGHRWIAFFNMDPRASNDRLRALLGRDEAHWSYFMDSNQSPMEGNWWRDNGNGTFTTRTTFNNWAYNGLDLYLMGLIPVDDVPPWYAIGNPDASGAVDLQGQRPTPASPPQIIQPATVRGTKVDYQIGDVTSAFGARFPPAGQAPTTFKVLFIMLANSTGLTNSQRVEFERMVDAQARGYNEGTGGRASLIYALQAGPTTPIGGICADISECDPSQSTLCGPYAGGGGLVCSRACRSATGCPSNWCCQPDDNGFQICHPRDRCSVTPVPDAGVVDTGMSQSPGCACDTTTACTPGCACDPECFGGRADCACDVTTACDPDCQSCDPECLSGSGGGNLRTTNSSCGCHHTSPASDYGVLFTLLVGFAALAWRRRTS